MLAVSLAAMALPAAVAAYPGDLDPSFGKYGKQGSFIEDVTGDEAFYNLSGNDVVVQSGGPIMVAARGFDPYHGFLGGLLGLDAGGQVGTNGGFGFARSPGTTSLESVVELADGSLLAAGLPVGGGPRIVLVRILRDGSPDVSFGGDGAVDVELASDGIADVDLALGPAGKIVVAAALPNGLLIARALPDGSPDPSFAGGGSTVLGVGATEAASIATLRGGEAIAAGTVLEGGVRHAVVAKVDATGASDPGFSGDGIAEPPGASTALDLAVDDQGRAVVAGSSVDAPAAFRLLANGEADRGFDGDGHVLGRGTGSFNGGAVQPDGKLVFVGSEFTISRFTDQGARDIGFGRRGIARTSMGAYEFSSANATAVALQPNGKIVAAGGTRGYGARSFADSIAIARYLVEKGVRDADADGVPDKRDRCRYDPARKHRGCPIVRPHRKVILYRSLFGFAGKVSHHYACDRSRVVLKLAAPGRDRTVARRWITSPFGLYKVKVRHPNGRYYAVVRPRVVFRLGLCPGDRSPRVSAP